MIRRQSISCMVEWGLYLEVSVLRDVFWACIHLLDPILCLCVCTWRNLYNYLMLYNHIVILYSRRQWHPTPVLLPGKSHGWRSLEGCSPWGCWGSNMTKRLHFHFSLSCIGEGNGNPLQCSCLENPRDREAWWAAIYGVTQSRTRLKWLSNSNSILHYT